MPNVTKQDNADRQQQKCEWASSLASSCKDCECYRKKSNKRQKGETDGLTWHVSIG